MKKILFKILNAGFDIGIFLVSIFTNFIYFLYDLFSKFFLLLAKFCKKYQGRILRIVKALLIILIILSIVMSLLLGLYLKNTDLINPKLVEFMNKIKNINSIDLTLKILKGLIPVISSLVISIIGGLVVDLGSKKRTNDYQRKRLLTSLSELYQTLYHYQHLSDFKYANDYEIILDKVNQILEDGMFVLNEKEFYIIDYMQKAIKNMLDLKLKIADKEDAGLISQVYVDLDIYLSNNKDCKSKIQYDSLTFSVDGRSFYYSNSKLNDEYHDYQTIDSIIRYLMIFYIYKEILLPKFHKVFDYSYYLNHINPYYVRCET